jgi:hypothetical protein
LAFSLPTNPDSSNFSNRLKKTGKTPAGERLAVPIFIPQGWEAANRGEQKVPSQALNLRDFLPSRH